MRVYWCRTWVPDLSCNDVSRSVPPIISLFSRACLKSNVSPVRRLIIVSHRYLCHEVCPLDLITTWGFCHRPLGRCPGQSGTCIKELRASQTSIQLPPLDSPDHCGKSKSYLPLSFLSNGFLTVSFAVCSTTLSHYIDRMWWCCLRATENMEI